MHRLVLQHIEGLLPGCGQKHVHVTTERGLERLQVALLVVHEQYADTVIDVHAHARSSCRRC